MASEAQATSCCCNEMAIIGHSLQRRLPPRCRYLGSMPGQLGWRLNEPINTSPQLYSCTTWTCFSISPGGDGKLKTLTAYLQCSLLDWVACVHFSLEHSTISILERDPPFTFDLVCVAEEYIVDPQVVYFRRGQLHPCPHCFCGPMRISLSSLTSCQSRVRTTTAQM